MGKKPSKKVIPKKQGKKEEKGSVGKNKRKGKMKKTKINPGKKECRNCEEEMPIHQIKCPTCAHIHHMKRNKHDIMRNLNLNKVTPIVIKSIIENNDFNQFGEWNENHIYQVGGVSKTHHDHDADHLEEIIHNLEKEKKPRHSSTSKRGRKEEQANAQNNSNKFKKTNHMAFEYIKSAFPISCQAASPSIYLYLEQVRKLTVKHTHNEEQTIKAYEQLNDYHCYNIDYVGRSTLKYCYTNDSVFDEIQIKDRHIFKAKIYCNLVALLTGTGTLIVFSLPIGAVRKGRSESLKYTLEGFTEIIEARPERITAFEFLRGSALNESSAAVSIIVGTSLGHISIYRVARDEYHLQRYIAHAHREMVTCIAECPLNSREGGMLFASGCYDGSVSIWDVAEKNRIYSFESSNRKIWSIIWDPGAKFILITRDEINECSLIGCFYSIHKIDTNVLLAHTMEMRTIKNQKHLTLTHHDFYSKFIPSIDPLSATFKLLSLEEIRANSLKKKKPKKEDSLDQVYRISFGEEEGVSIDLLAEQEEREEGKEGKERKEGKEGKERKEEGKAFPIISDVLVQNHGSLDVVFLSTYAGYVVRYTSIKSDVP